MIVAILVPPAVEKGKTLVADVALVDQFGNEHWIRGLEFRESR
jgi:hypothetical protein